MSLHALETYTQSILDDLPMPTLPALAAWVLPPPLVQPGERPVAYVWGGTGREMRATLPRPLGQKRTEWSLRVYLQWIGPNDDGESFPLLLEAVMAKVRGVLLPVMLTDPFTGAQSFCQDYGERLALDHPVPRPLAPQADLQHVATLTITTDEWFTA